MSLGASVRRVPLLETNEVTRAVVDAAVRIRMQIGPGLLERPYKLCLVHELRKRGLSCEVEVPIALRYDDLTIEGAYRMDVVVERTVVVEVKAVREIDSIHVAQILTYLDLTGHPVGLLVNFGAPRMKEGIRRVVGRSYRPREQELGKPRL